jgi:hypothetical protein
MINVPTDPQYSLGLFPGEPRLVEFPRARHWIFLDMPIRQDTVQASPNKS